MQRPVITLLTDFSTKDCYVAAMKGVILGINPDARIVDLGHEISPQDVFEGALFLRGIFPYFPRATFHVCVVDPGVGGSRRPIMVEARGQTFIGPDNGLFTFVYDMEPRCSVRSLTADRFHLPDPSVTFHGRDIFAPSAAHLSLGVDPGALGETVNDPVRLEAPTVTRTEDRIEGTVIHIDSFGNCITNIDKGEFSAFITGSAWKLTVGDAAIEQLHRSYGEVPPGVMLALVGSEGLIEVSINQGQADEALSIAKGAGVKVEKI